MERDTKKAKHYCERAAIGGDMQARHTLGNFELQADVNRAVKHWMISAGAGDEDSLKAVQKCFMAGHATKDDFEKALRANKEAKDDMKSDQRDAAVKVSAVGRTTATAAGRNVS